MKNFRKRMMVVGGGLVVTFGAVGVLVACSSNDTVVTADGGQESGVDGGSDTGSDSSATDAGKDVIVVEAGTLADFLKQSADATCQRYKDCCTAGTTKTFNLAKCLADYDTVGWNGNLSDITGADGGVATGGKLTYNAAAGTACLTAIRNMTCTNTPAAEFKAAWVQCFAAVTGTVPNGQACRSNAECNGNSWCTPDGGTCAPFTASGGACDPFSGECSYRAVGATQCRDDGTGSYKCGAPLANGTDCNFDRECNSGACYVRDLPDAQVKATCEDTVDYLYGTCSAYLQ